MGINELFDGIAKVVERFAEELSEQRVQERMSRTGRDGEKGLEKTEKKEATEKRVVENFPKRE